MNLMDSSFGDLPAPKAKEDANTTADEYYPHWLPMIDMNLVYDTTTYQKGRPMPSEVAERMITEKDGTY